jgi:hypothetical protein
MASANSQRLRDALARTHWDEAAALLRNLRPEDAAAIVGKLSFEVQQPDRASWNQFLLCRPRICALLVRSFEFPARDSP